jgi:hypothetical protein
LRDDLVAHGLRHPLTILPDGRVIDGGHRLDLAGELGLDPVPVRVAQLPLPLTEADQLRIETFAVSEAIGRRQLTRHQITSLLLGLEVAMVEGAALDRRTHRLANLRRGRTPGVASRTAPTIDALARATGLSARRIGQLLTIAHRGTPELRAAVGRGEQSVWSAYRQIIRPAAPGPSDPPPPWQAAVAALGASAHALIELTLDLARDAPEWPAASREAVCGLLQRAAEAVEGHLERVVARLDADDAAPSPSAEVPTG